MAVWWRAAAIVHATSTEVATTLLFEIITPTVR